MSTPTPRTDECFRSYTMASVRETMEAIERDLTEAKIEANDFAFSLGAVEAQLTRVAEERDELKKSRDAAAWVNQQLTLVLINAGAPEFSSAAHALEWATETAALRARVAELERDIADITEVWGHQITDYLEAKAEGRAKEAAREEDISPADLLARCCDLEQRVAELEGALESIAAGDGDERRRAEDALTRAESATPAKCKTCGGSGMTAGWVPTYNDPDNSGLREAAEPCPDCATEPAPHADTVRLDWLFANTIIAAPDGHVIDCREDLDAAMKGGAHD